jgi:hypothetical protein
VLEAFGKITPVVRADVARLLQQRHAARGVDAAAAQDLALVQAAFLAGEPWRELLEGADPGLRARVKPHLESLEPWALQVLREEDQMREVVLYQLRIRSLLRFNKYVQEGRGEEFYETDEHHRVSEILNAFGGEPDEPADPEEFQDMVLAFHRRTQMRLVPRPEGR